MNRKLLANSFETPFIDYYFELVKDLSTSILLYNTKTLVFEFANVKALNLLGLNKQNLPHFSITGKDKQKENVWKDLVEQCLKKGESTFKIDLHKNSGHLFTCEVHLKKISSLFPPFLQVELKDTTLESSLKEKEAQYRTLTERFPNGMIALYDKELRFSFVDGEILKTLGLQKSDLVNKRIKSIFSKKIFEGFESKLLAALNGTTSQSILELAGEHFNTFTIPVKNKTGQVISGMAIFQNITKFIESEKKVKNVLQQLELAIKHSKMGIWRLNLETNTADWNDQMLQIYEITREEFESEYEKWNNQVHPADRADIGKYLERMIQGESIYDMEFRVFSPKGTLKYIKAAGTPSLVEDGVVKEILGINIDITYNKEKEAESKEKEQALRAIFNNSMHAILVTDDQGNFISTNPAASNVFGFSKEEFSNLKIAEFQKNLKQQSNSKTGNVHFKDGEIGEFTFKRNGEEERVIKYHTFKFEDHYNLSILADTTSEKRAEEQRFRSKQLELKNEELERFAYLASHDLREPLRTVASFAKLIDKKYKNAVGEEGAIYLDIIQKAAHRMAELINVLLEHSRLGAKLVFNQINCQDLVETICQDLAIKIKETSTIIEIGNLPKIKGLNVEMKILFQNLIANAIKFRKKDLKPQIFIDCIEKDYVWKFSVKDNGIGIDPEHHHQIFEIFRRIHGSKEYQGTGIGLAHCKRIVDIHGGKIWIESEVGTGSTFFFTIPKNSNQ